jgi:3',5'-cyclic AMP phosphodiesterase CpdA
MREHVTIAHLSDLHLTADNTTPRSEPKLFGRLKGMNTSFRRLLADEDLRAARLVLVTGDITDRGLLIEWEQFWKAVDEAALTPRMVVLPGNHDVCCLGLRRQRPRAEDWARARQGLAMGGQEHAFPWIRRHDTDVAFFGVDSANAGNLSGLDNAIGRIGHHQLAELGRSLLLYQDVPHKFILLHHSPNIPAPATSRRRGEKVTPVWERKTLQLEPFDRRALRLLARIFRVKAILHGHTHAHLDRHVGGVRIIGAAASTEPDGEGCLSYKHYTLYRGTGTLRATTRRCPA